MVRIGLSRATLALAAGAVLGACASAGNSSLGAVNPAQSPSASTRIGRSATLEKADSAWQAGAYPLAEEMYEAVLARDSSSHIAMFRLATLRSWDNRLDDAIALFRRYVAVEPNYSGGRTALARVVAWTGNYAGAIAIYDSVLTREPNNRDAVLGRAQTLAWANQFDQSLAAYKKWTTAHPTDRDAAIDYARALAWNGQLGEAESRYAELSRTGNANATKGLARVIGWRGDLQRSEETWRRVLVTDPNDPEALTGLAQVLSWQGRETDAETALQAALRSNPGYGDARSLLRFVEADLRPAVIVSAIGSNDSDKNRATILSLDYIVRAPWSGSIGARYSERWANFPGAVDVDSRADAGNLFARWQPASSSWVIRADAGMTHHSSTLVPSTDRKENIVNGALAVRGNLARSLNVGLSASRTAFDETALLIANGVVSAEYSGDASVALPGRLTLSGAASRAQLTGGSSDNSRDAFAASLRWTYNRRWSFAVGGRQFGYDTTSSDGYFSPRRYTLAEASGRGRVGGTLGWNAEGDVGLGRQSVELFGASAASRLAERAALTMGYRFDPAHEFSASGNYANVAGPGQTGGSEYRFFSFTLRARVGF
ncbi:MAG TPA: tetratricopeptide repeat protein [Gemmatimonadaceae bacterium]|jgi:tetratricopeptide (TPR) repeat protein|nr:tetratricopeptide repeat protein [Gemmatimonadaceae bacterium]